MTTIIADTSQGMHPATPSTALTLESTSSRVNRSVSVSYKSEGGEEVVLEGKCGCARHPTGRDSALPCTSLAHLYHLETAELELA